MREIKFRGYSLFGDRWIYGRSIFNVGTVCSICEDEEIEKSLLENRGALGVGVDPETVGQFTGLYDKNGKEIYENSILRCCFVDENGKSSHKEIYNVRYFSGVGGFIVYDFYDTEGDFIQLTSSEISKHNMEVVGNDFNFINDFENE